MSDDITTSNREPRVNVNSKRHRRSFHSPRICTQSRAIDHHEDNALPLYKFQSRPSAAGRSTASRPPPAARGNDGSCTAPQAPRTGYRCHYLRHRRTARLPLIPPRGGVSNMRAGIRLQRMNSRMLGSQHKRIRSTRVRTSRRRWRRCGGLRSCMLLR